MKDQKDKIEKVTNELVSLRSETASFKQENELLRGEVEEQERMLQASERQRESMEVKLNRMMEEHHTERKQLQEN